MTATELTISDSENRAVPDTKGDAGQGGVVAAEAAAGFCTTKLATLPEAALLDERALADCLKVSPRTVRRMIGRGQLPPGVKLGGRRVWMAGKVVAFLSAEADRLMASAKRLYLRRLEVGA